MKQSQKTAEERLQTLLQEISAKLDALDENGCQDFGCCALMRELRQIVQNAVSVKQ